MCCSPSRKKVDHQEKEGKCLEVVHGISKVLEAQEVHQIMANEEFKKLLLRVAGLFLNPVFGVFLAYE